MKTIIVLVSLFFAAACTSILHQATVTNGIEVCQSHPVVVAAQRDNTGWPPMLKIDVLNIQGESVYSIFCLKCADENTEVYPVDLAPGAKTIKLFCRNLLPKEPAEIKILFFTSKGCVDSTALSWGK